MPTLMQIIMRALQKVQSQIMTCAKMFPPSIIKTITGLPITIPGMGDQTYYDTLMLVLSNNLYPFYGDQVNHKFSNPRSSLLLRALKYLHVPNFFPDTVKSRQDAPSKHLI